jgi:hypothetical protein
MAWSVPKIGALATPVTSGNLTLAEPAGIATGDLMVACIAYRSTAAFTVPGDWNLVATQQSSGDTDATNGIASGLMMWCVRGGSAPTLTFNRTAGDMATGRIIAYEGAAASPFDTGTANTLGAASATVTTGTFSTAEAGELIVAMVSYGDNLAVSAFDATDPSTASGATDTTTAPTAGTWIERADNGTNTGADGGLGIADAIRATAGATGTIQATVTASARHVMIAAAFKANNNITASTDVGAATAAGLAPQAYGSPPALRFTSASSQCANRTASVPDYNAAYTWLAWVRLTTAGDSNHFAVSADGNNYDQFYRTSAGGILQLQVNVGGAATTISGSTVLNADTWYLIAVRRNSAASAELFIGTTSANLAAEGGTNTRDTTSRTAAGRLDLASFRGSGPFLNGMLTAAKLWTRALTLAEMKTEGDYFEPVDATNVWGAWRLDDLTTGIQDNTGNSRDLTVTNGPLTLETGLDLLEPATGVTVTPGVGAVTAAGLAPTVQTPALVTPALGAVTAAGLAPTVTVNTIAATALGTVTAAGLAPTIQTPVTVTPALGTVAATGLAPTIQTPVTVTTALGTVTAAGLEPTITVAVQASPGVGVLVAAGLAPTVLTPRTVTPALGDVTAAGLAPTVTTTAHVTVTPALGTVDAAGLVPTVTATTNTLVRPDLGTVAAAGLAPTVTATTNTLVRPALGEVTAAGLAPTAEGGAGVTARPALGDVTAAGLAPTVTATNHQTVTPALGTVDAAGLAPTVVTPVTVTPALGAVTAAGFAPTISIAVVVFPATGEATIAGLAPTVLTPRTVTPAVGTVTAVGLEPTVLTPVTVVSATGELDATGYVPTATVTAGVTVRPGVGAVVAAGYAPEIDTGQQVVTPETGTLVLKGMRPTVTGSPATAAIRRIVSPSEILDIILRDGHRKPRWW